MVVFSFERKTFRMGRYLGSGMESRRNLIFLGETTIIIIIMIRNFDIDKRPTLPINQGTVAVYNLANGIMVKALTPREVKPGRNADTQLSGFGGIVAARMWDQVLTVWSTNPDKMEQLHCFSAVKYNCPVSMVEHEIYPIGQQAQSCLFFGGWPAAEPIQIPTKIQNIFWLFFLIGRHLFHTPQNRKIVD